MLDSHFWVALTSSFWIIPREGTEALLIVLMICSALKKSDRSNQYRLIYKCCGLALLCGMALVAGCVFMQHVFTGQARELSEAFSSLIAMSMILYVNFSVFSGNKSLADMSILALGFMAFISVFREIAEVVLFYIALFQGSTSQQVGTLSGAISGALILAMLIYAYNFATDKWKKANKIIFSLTPFFMFMLATMCIGNAIESFQEAGWLGFSPCSWMINSDLFHIQSSKEYVLAAGLFLCSTGMLFIQQFMKPIRELVSWIISLFSRKREGREVKECNLKTLV